MQFTTLSYFFLYITVCHSVVHEAPHFLTCGRKRTTCSQPIHTYNDIQWTDSFVYWYTVNGFIRILIYSERIHSIMIYSERIHSYIDIQWTIHSILIYSERVHSYVDIQWTGPFVYLLYKWWIYLVVYSTLWMCLYKTWTVFRKMVALG